MMGDTEVQIMLLKEKRNTIETAFIRDLVLILRRIRIYGT